MKKPNKIDQYGRMSEEMCHEVSEILKTYAQKVEDENLSEKMFQLVMMEVASYIIGAAVCILETENEDTIREIIFGPIFKSTMQRVRSISKDSEDFIISKNVGKAESSV